MSTLIAYARRLAHRARDVPSIVVDAVIALACFLAIATQAIVDDRLEWWLVLLATANTLPLLWRRQYPLTVTAVVGVSTTWLSILDAPTSLAAAQLVATYTFAAYSPPWRRLIGVAGTVVGITVSIVVPGDELLNLGPNAIFFVVAYALGTSARARRDRIAMLEERARRLAEQQAAAETRERERIAREIHDILAHSMSLVAVQAEAGPIAVRSDPAKAEEVFDRISTTARDALTQLRRVIGVLRSDEPARQPQPGLDAVPTLLTDVRRAGLVATLEEHGERRPLSPDLAMTAYRIIQESLTNTLKHARATRVRVRMEWLGEALCLEVRDDGRGPSANGTTSGRGLIGMRERVAAAGGELAVGPAPDGIGFVVAASLPVQ